MSYENKLETYYNNAHWAVRKVMNVGGCYSKVNGAIKQVAGEPQQLEAAGANYLALGNRMATLESEVNQVVAALRVWEGPARQTFQPRAQSLATNLATLGKAVGQTNEVLKAAAKAAMECANAIIDAAKAFIEFLISSLATSLALSALTLGAAAAAWVAANLAKGAQLLSRITVLGQKFVKLMNAIAKVLNLIAKIFKKIQAILKAISKAFKWSKEFKKRKEFGMVLRQAVSLASTGAIKAGTAKVVDPITPGFDMPSAFGEAKQLKQDTQDARSAAQEAERQASSIEIPSF